MENEKYGDIKKIKYKIDNLKKRWRKLNTGENVGKFKDDKNFYLDEKKRLNKERDSLIKGVSTCQNNIKQYKEKMEIGVCPFCDRKITNECVEKFELKMYESELRLKKFLTLKRKNESKLEKIELSIIEVENFISSDIERRNKIFRIDSDIGALYDQLDTYKNNENKIKLLKHDFYMFRKEILLQISKIKNTINIDIDGINDKYNLVKEKVNIYNAEITNLKLEISNLKNKLRNYRSIKRKLSDSQVKIDLIQNNINIYDYLKNIFFKCKLHYINIISDKLKYHVTKILSEINMDAEIDFVTSTNKIDSDVVIDKFDIIIKFKGKPPRDVKTYSSGEKRRFNVAVTISILEVIEAFGNKWNTLILDEIFVNLDDIGMSLISSVINNLNKNIHIITLDLNSKKFYDNCRVTKIIMDEDGKSRIIKKGIGFSE
jgi:hypothetical protein